jgi:hypothetical protein
VTWENGVEHSGSLCFADTEEVTGSNPVAPTTVLPGQSPLSTWRTALLTRCGRAAAAGCSPPNQVGLRSWTTRDHHQPTDHSAWSPPLGPGPWSGGQAAPQPGSRPSRRTWATVDPRASQGRPTSHHRFPLGPMPAGDHAAHGPRRHVDPLRPTEGRPTTPSHSRAQRGPDSAAAPRTPEACPSGHLDTGCPLDRLDGRPDGGTVDADRATTGLASVRTSSRPATIRWAARPCLGHGAWERSATQDGHGICAAY